MAEEEPVFGSCDAYFVAFILQQRSQIRIYNVEKDWEVQKDLVAKSLRWTITDTCLSPDQRFLVSSVCPGFASFRNDQSVMRLLLQGSYFLATRDALCHLILLEVFPLKTSLNISKIQSEVCVSKATTLCFFSAYLF